MIMSNYHWIMLAYLMLINFFGLILVGTDKKRSRKRQWRIAEKHFFSLSLAGGAIGIYSGMKLFHHKTKHPLFTWGIPGLAVLNLALLYYFF